MKLNLVLSVTIHREYALFLLHSFVTVSLPKKMGQFLLELDNEPGRAVRKGKLVSCSGFPVLGSRIVFDESFMYFQYAYCLPTTASLNYIINGFIETFFFRKYLSLFERWLTISFSVAI